MKQYRLACYLFLVLICFSSFVFAKEKVWLLVDTVALNLSIKRGGDTLAVFENIAIGRNGAGFKKRRGDDVTPIGTYTIRWINEKSPFYRFFGFDYPSVENANEALLRGLLSKEKHTSIVKAHKKNKLPPQNTPLGGRIGIHGLGAGDKEIHKLMNWTHGCIALTNEQIQQLEKWIVPGVQVKVK